MKKLILPFFILLAYTAFGQGFSYSGGVTTGGGGHTTTQHSNSNYSNSGSYNYSGGQTYVGGGRSYNRGNDRGYTRRGSRSGYNYGGRSCEVRVINRPSACGTFTWRIKQERRWTEGFYDYRRGCRVWVPGCWNWVVIFQERIYPNACGGW